MRRTWIVALILSCASCAKPDPWLDGFSAAYTTHFDGVPDQASVCARVTHRGRERLDWIELRLQSFSELGEVPARFRSRWVYLGRLEPGQTISLELANPPAASRVKLRVGRRGTGRPRRPARLASRVETCDDASLARRLEARVADRTAPGITIVQTPSHADAPLLAESD